MKMENVFIVLRVAVSTKHENSEDTLNEILQDGHCLLTNTENVEFFAVRLSMISLTEPNLNSDGTQS